MRHPKTELISDYLDGDLTPDQAQELEAHLAVCPGCASLLEDLREIQGMARSLADQVPQRDLWPEISRNLGASHGRGGEVIPLHPDFAEDLRHRRTRGFRISYVQAAAAAVILALFSGAAGLSLGSSGKDSASLPLPAEVQWLALVSQDNPDLTGVAEEIAQLEQRLALSREELDPETIRLLEKNLAIIDKAIRESVQALEADPGNRFLESHLARTVEAKATYLREATAFVAPAG